MNNTNTKTLDPRDARALHFCKKMVSPYAGFIIDPTKETSTEKEIFEDFFPELLMILVSFKSKEKDHNFFNEHATLADDLSVIKHLTESGIIKFLKYNQHIIHGEGKNFYMTCWEFLYSHVFTPQTKTPAPQAIKEMINSFTQAFIKSSPEIIIDELIRARAKNHHLKLSLKESELTSLVLELSSIKNNSNIMIDENCGLPHNKTHNINFLSHTDPINYGLDVFTHNLIKAYATDTNINSLLFFNKEINQKLHPSKEFKELKSYYKTSPLIVNNVYTAIKKKLKYDLVLTTLLDTIDPFRVSGQIDSEKGNHIIDFYNSLDKILNKDGKLAIALLNHNSHKIIGFLKEKLQHVEAIAFLKEFSVIVFSKKTKKSLLYFDARLLTKNNKSFEYEISKIIEALRSKNPIATTNIDSERWSKEFSFKLDLKKALMPAAEPFDEPFGEIFQKIVSSGKTKKRKGKIVGISDLSDPPGYLDLKSIKSQQIEEFKKLKEIKEDCLLIAMVGKKLKPTFFKYKEEPVFLKSNVTALRLKNDFMSEKELSFQYLMYELSNEENQSKLRYLQSGTAIPHIKYSDLENLNIKIPQTAQQGVNTITYNKNKILEKLNLLQLHNEIKEEGLNKLRSLRHAMGDYLNNISSSIELLKMKTKGLNDETINKSLNRENLNLKTRLLKIEKDFNNLIELNTRFKDGLEFDEKTYPLEKISCKELIEETASFLKSNTKQNFENILVLRKNGEKTTKQGLRTYFNYVVEINKKAYRLFLLQFLNNTDKHAGFKKGNNKKNHFIVSMEFDGSEMFLVIMNNGRPFDKKISKKEFTALGYTTNENLGHGIGGNQINQIASLFRINKWNVISQKEEEYPVQFKFNLNLDIL